MRLTTEKKKVAYSNAYSIDSYICPLIGSEHGVFEKLKFPECGEISNGFPSVDKSK